MVDGLVKDMYVLRIERKKENKHLGFLPPLSVSLACFEHLPK